MKDLIERLEKSEGPDRELDCLIWTAVNGKGQPMKTVAEPYYEPPRFFCNPNPEINWIGYDLLNVAERYTASLDSALTLVPEGLAWTLGQNVHHRYWQASVHNLDEDGRPQSIGYSSLQGNRTAPIALCAAALKARAASERDMEAGR